MTLLTVRQAAARLGVGYSTLKHWIYEGRVRTRVTSGGHHRIADTEVDRLLAPSAAAAPRSAVVDTANHDRLVWPLPCPRSTITRTTISAAARRRREQRDPDLGPGPATRTKRAAPPTRRGFLFYGLLETRRAHSGGDSGRGELRGADGRLHERGRARGDAAHRLRHLLQPLAEHAVDEGRDVREQARGARDFRRLRRGHGAAEGE